ncbi:Zn-dependent hydrolase [Sneathiella limimaris]|uniref:Zn-dependent hydrolase n=1 Tax=Sneathiella limimaris TaxID=1964213 RepID=UPI00146BE1DA|nr:Zn-dependent hydrolase [Sneathiella limimaris]
MTKTTFSINIERLNNRIQKLGEVGALQGGGVCRLALSEEDRLGRDLVRSWMEDLGLDVTVDRIGNIIGIREGRQALPPVMTGSHIDTVRTGGLYDGNLGVLAGLEVIACLNDLGLETERPVAVGIFTNEEGARFAPDMMGSLVYVGGLDLDEALETTGIDGKSVGDCLSEIGYAGKAHVGSPEVHAFLELHVEQGPVLEEEGVMIGAVNKVQGISWTEFTIKGVSNHAGTTPMRLRRDAGYVAMETGQFARKLAKRMGGDQVATVGAFKLTPNLVNVVPNQAIFTVDLRNTNNEKLLEAEQELFAFVEEIAAAEGVSVSRRELARFDPVDFDDGLVGRVAGWAEHLGYSVKTMPSGAGHDAQMLARVCPTAMVFVPSENGISHNIKEYTAPEEIERGANILLNLMIELAQEKRSFS